MITLTYPWLLLLAPAPLLVRALTPSHARPSPAVEVPFLERLARLVGVEPGPEGAVRRRSRSQVALGLLTWAGLILALVRPQWIEAPLVRTLASRDLMLAVDLSGSMDTRDFRTPEGEALDRLGAVKSVLDDFLTRREGDRVGLIVFGNAAFLQAPFSEDLETCRQLLQEVQVGMAGPRTALGDAIGLALSHFERSELEERVLILLTDGNDTGSDVTPPDAARIARDRGVTIHVVAVGDPAASGEDILDEKTLREVARITGGEYRHAQDREALEGVYAALDALSTRELETMSHRPRRDLYHWPLALVVVTVLAAQLLAVLRGGRSLRVG